MDGPSGKIAFYGPEADTLIGEYGKYEGVLIPRGCPYWFESVGDEPAELIQFEAFDIRIPDDKTLMKDRIDFNVPTARWSRWRSPRSSRTCGPHRSR